MKRKNPIFVSVFFRLLLLLFDDLRQHEMWLNSKKNLIPKEKVAQMSINRRKLDHEQISCSIHYKKGFLHFLSPLSAKSNQVLTFIFSENLFISIVLRFLRIFTFMNIQSFFLCWKSSRVFTFLQSRGVITIQRLMDLRDCVQTRGNLWSDYSLSLVNFQQNAVSEVQRCWKFSVFYNPVWKENFVDENILLGSLNDSEFCCCNRIIVFFSLV